MNRNLSLVIALVLSSVACINGADPDGPSSSTTPPLSAEDQAIVDNLETKKLVDVSVGDGKVSFYELEPGEFIATVNFPVGAQAPALPAGGSLLEAFRAVAPDREVPAAISNAMERAATAQRPSETVPASIEPATTFQPQRATPATIDGVEQRQSALASVFDWTWFHNTYCKGYAGPFEMTYCMAAAYNGAWARCYTHRTNNITCGDTGAGRLRMKVSGSTRHVTDFGYGQCTGYWYHGPHDIFGTDLERTVEYSLDWVESSVRFAGWCLPYDAFIATPPGL